MNPRMTVVVVYKGASDSKFQFCAREHHILEQGGQRPGDLVIESNEYKTVRDYIESRYPNLVLLDRHPSDDPVILQTWV